MILRSCTPVSPLSVVLQVHYGSLHGWFFSFFFVNDTDSQVIERGLIESWKMTCHYLDRRLVCTSNESYDLRTLDTLGRYSDPSTPRVFVQFISRFHTCFFFFFVFGIFIHFPVRKPHATLTRRVQIRKCIISPCPIVSDFISFDYWFDDCARNCLCGLPSP